MSKTTATLFVILLIFISLLLFILVNPKENQIINSLRQPTITPSGSVATTVSLTTNQLSVQSGQTVTIAVVLQNPVPHPTLAQIELAYDPLVVTVESISPGSFFTNPTIVLQNIDPVAGRISYALACPTPQTDCVNPASSTLALLTITINPYTLKNITTLSLLQKTVVRMRNGKDLLKKTSGLQLTITKPLFPISSSSAVASQGAIFNSIH